MLAFVALGGCTPPAPRAVADRIYIGGDIVTVNDAQPLVEALATKGGKILAVGTRAQLEAAYRGSSTEMVDLGGKTLVPGFVDGHSHFMDSLAAAGRANVSAPPVGPASDPAEIVTTLRNFAEEMRLKSGELLVGYGYDENMMPKGHALTRDFLDKASRRTR